MENEDFKVPCKAAFEFITPETAKLMLDAGTNRRNRKVTQPPVKRLQGVIRRGEWMYDSTDGVGLAKDGSVVNGQHRLTAIAEGSQGVWCLVVRNVRPEIIKVIDQPTMRTLTQALEIDGRFAEPGTVAAAIKVIYKMIYRFPRTVPGAYKATIPQELELLTQHPHLTDSLTIAGKVHRKLGVLPKATWAACHYTFSQADAELADQFYTALVTGEDINDGDPAYLLRERFISEPAKEGARKRTLDKVEAEFLLITAWEAARSGELTTKETRMLRSAFPLSSATFPTVSGVSWLAEVPKEAA